MWTDDFKVFLFSHTFCYVVSTIKNKCEHITIEYAWYNY